RQDHDCAYDQVFSLNAIGLHFLSCSSCATGNRSQKINESRSTTSPARNGIGRRKIGPSNANVWNSPFSPHGSAFAGRSAKKLESSSRPANVSGRIFGSIQAVTERNLWV